MSDSLTLSVPGGLTAIELHRVRLPLLEPFVASHGTEHDRDVVLVRVLVDHGEGWAECSTLSAPTYVDESTDTAWDALRSSAAAVLAAAGSSCVLGLDGRRAAVAALEIALLDATNVWRDGWPSGVRGAVPAMAVIGQKPSIDELLASVGRAVDEGYASVKLKIAPGWDAEPLAAVRSAWPSLGLASDANGSYRRDELRDVAALERFALSYVEQPFASDHQSALLLLRRAGTKVALDESIRSVDDARQAIADGAVDVINVKPARLGGLAPSVAVATVARDAGVSCFVGGMLETGVGRSVALRLAARPEFNRPTDLGPSSRYFADDITDPIGWAAPGLVAVPDGEALARRPLADRLAACTVDLMVVRP